MPLWFTSRTPARDGQTHCAMSRYLGQHAGVHGTGWRRRATAVPLATGTYVHKGVELLTGWWQEWSLKHPGQQLTAMPAEVIRWAAGTAADQYEAKARKQGLLVTLGDLDSNEGMLTLIAEQRTLVEGLVWVWALFRLPMLLASYRILAIEQTDTIMLDCTCGLGDAVSNWRLHETRGCQGICHQGKGDLLLESLTDETRPYIELKTASSSNIGRERGYEHDGQLLLNIEAASRKHGKRIGPAFVDVLYKGWRGRDKGDPLDAPKYQHSILCYGYFDPGSPPVREPGWAAEYWWTDQMGKRHRLGNQYKKTPIWDDTLPMPMIAPDATRVESWIRGYVTMAMLPDLMKVLGPFEQRSDLLNDALASVRAEENEWRDRVVTLHEANIHGPDGAQAVISRSFQCTNYDGTPCAFKLICDKTPGWQDPGTMTRGDGQVIYIPRKPHHSEELAALIDRGLTFESDDDDDDDTDSND